MQKKKYFHMKLVCFILFLGLFTGGLTGQEVKVGFPGDVKGAIEISAVVIDSSQIIFADKHLTRPTRKLERNDRINNISGFVENSYISEDLYKSRIPFVLRLTGKMINGKAQIEYTKLGYLYKDRKLTGGRIYLSFEVILNNAVTLTEEGKLRISFSSNSASILEGLKKIGTDVEFKITSKNRKEAVRFKVSEISNGAVEKSTDFMIGDQVMLSIASPNDDDQYRFVNPYNLFRNERGVLAEGIFEPARRINATITIDLSTFDLSIYSEQKTFTKKFPISFDFPILSQLKELKSSDAGGVTLTAKAVESNINNSKEGSIWTVFKNKKEFEKFIEDFKKQGTDSLDFKTVFILDNEKEIDGRLTVKMLGPKESESLFLYIIIGVVFFVIVSIASYRRYHSYKKSKKENIFIDEGMSDEECSTVLERTNNEQTFADLLENNEKPLTALKELDIKTRNISKNTEEATARLKFELLSSIEKDLSRMGASIDKNEELLKQLKGVFNALNHLLNDAKTVSNQVQDIKQNILPQFTEEVPKIKKEYENLIQLEQRNLQGKITQWLKSPHTKEEFDDLLVGLNVELPKSMNVLADIKMFSSNMVRDFMGQVLNLIIELENCRQTFLKFDDFFKTNSLLKHPAQQKDWYIPLNKTVEHNLLECLHQCLLLLRSKKIVVHTDSLYSFKEKLESENPEVVNVALNEWLFVSYLEGYVDNFFIIHQLLENGFTKEIKKLKNDHNYLGMLNDLYANINNIMQKLKGFSIYPLTVNIYSETINDLIKKKIISTESIQSKVNIEEVEGPPYVEGTENGTVVRISRMRYAKSESGTDSWTVKEGKFRVYIKR